MKLQMLIITMVALATSQSFAINRVGTPISSSRWDEYLPMSAHTGFPADLGSLTEGRISMGFQDLDLANLSVTLPGFQVISANSRWSAENDTTLFGFVQDSIRLFHDGNWGIDRFRGFFAISGGLSLASFSTNPRIWDVGLGFTLESFQLYDESEKRMLWSERTLGSGVTARYGNLSLAGHWNPDEFKYRIGYVKPQDFQFGMMVYQNPNLEMAFGGQIGVEKLFLQSLKTRFGLHLQYLGRQMLQRKLMVGMALRFRPWQQGKDPEWTRSFLSPFGGENGKGRYLFDWEIAADFAIDQGDGNSSTALTLSKWF